MLTRGADARQLAPELGASSVGAAYDQPPVPLDSAVLFAPVGDWYPWRSQHSTRAAHWRWSARTTTCLFDRAPDALRDPESGAITGTAVLRVGR